MSAPGERWALSFPIAVQWGDVDRMGHVNNVWYARWIESARVEYFARIGMADADTGGAPPAEVADPPVLPRTEGPIVARISIDYRRPALHPDTVTVHVATTRLGRTSATHRYVVTSARFGGEVVAEAEVVWVLLDYAANRPVPIPPALRERIVAFEATAGRRPEGA